MAGHDRNTAAWLGPLVALVSLVSYFTVVPRWPALSDLPWLNLLGLALGVGLGILGLLRAWRRGGAAARLAALAGCALSLGAAALFVFYVFSYSYSLPDAAASVPEGSVVPALALPDEDGRPVDLREAARGDLLLVFFRGHW